MRRLFLCPLYLFFAGLVFAEPPRTLLEDSWDAAYLNDSKHGYVHTVARRVETDNAPIIRTTVELDLTVKRFNDTARLRMITGTDETPDGKVTGVSMRQFLGKSQENIVTGIVDGTRLRVKAGGAREFDKEISWNEHVVGLYRQERMYAERQVKPGDEFRYLSYEPTVTSVVSTRVFVKDYEDVEFPMTPTRRRLLRAEVVTDKIMGVQLPPLTVWLDRELMPVRSQVEVPGLGKLTLYRTTKALALRPADNLARQADLGFDQLIPLNRRIPDPYATTSATYRISIKGDDDPGTAFARDNRQQIKKVTGNSFELHVRVQSVPDATIPSTRVPGEFIESCYFINSDDTRVRQLARQAIAGETDSWRKARQIERWVHDHMQNKNFTENFATADHVARTLEGDCTEHAMLAAAMCRAADIPSRTAVGLIYVDGARGPCFGFHMWTEVWVHGQWMPIDATLGRGFVGATHLKVLDHSWHDVQSLTPLLPLLRVVGKSSIEVLSINRAD
jgi:transglutaminase-like putative cysteine protease